MACDALTQSCCLFDVDKSWRCWHCQQQPNLEMLNKRAKTTARESPSCSYRNFLCVSFLSLCSSATLASRIVCEDRHMLLPTQSELKDSPDPIKCHLSPGHSNLDEMIGWSIIKRSRLQFRTAQLAASYHLWKSLSVFTMLSTYIKELSHRYSILHFSYSEASRLASIRSSCFTHTSLLRQPFLALHLPFQPDMSNIRHSKNYTWPPEVGPLTPPQSTLAVECH